MNKIDRTNLTVQTRLNEISKMEYYFHQEFNQSKTSSKKLSKYFPAFD